MKSGMYICKCYWKGLTTGKITIVLKYGITNNIDVRMKHYNKNGKHYQLLYFRPCKDYLKIRENYLKEWGPDCIKDTWRLQSSEHIEYNKGYFKSIFKSINEACDFKIKRNKHGLEFN